MLGVKNGAVIQRGTSAGQSPALLFYDDFNGAAGSAPDASKWVAESVNSCNGSTIQGSFASDDAYLDGAGNLVLRAQSRASGGCGPNHYTSGQISTRGIYTRAFGRIAASIKMPAGGTGIWPAFWAYPISGSAWPQGGEYDIVEMNSDMSRADMTYHWDTGSGHQSSYVGYTDASLATGFHTYELRWSPGSVQWFIDGVERRTAYTGANVLSEAVNVLLGLQIGDYFAATVTPTLPQYMYVDWVGVWGR